MDKVEFRKCMVVLFTAYNREISKEVADVYYGYIKNFTIEELKFAIDDVIKKEKFFPSISTLLDSMVDDGVDESMIRADILKAISGFGRYKSPKFNHQISQAISEDIGWETMCNMSIEDLGTTIHFRYEKTHNAWINAKKNGTEFLTSPIKALFEVRNGRGNGFKKLGDINE